MTPEEMHFGAVIRVKDAFAAVEKLNKGQLLTVYEIHRNGYRISAWVGRWPIDAGEYMENVWIDPMHFSLVATEPNVKGPYRR